MKVEAAAPISGGPRVKAHLRYFIKYTKIRQIR